MSKAAPATTTSPERAEVKPPPIAFRSGSEPRSTKPREWLWPGRFPVGSLSLISGEPGDGKSSLVADMAARITAGLPWPDLPNMRQKPGHVLIISAEDESRDVLDRIADGGGNLDRVGVLGLEDPAEDLPILPRDADALGWAIVGTPSPCRLVVLDSILSVMPHINADRASEVRPVLQVISRLAAETGTTIIGIAHNRKQASTRATHATAGSGAFVQVVRAAWMVGMSRSEDGVRVLAKQKLSGCKAAPSLAFTIEGPTDRPGHVVWRDGTSAESADSLVCEPPRGGGGRVPSPKLAKARAMILASLGEGPKPSRAVVDPILAAGVSEHYIKRAMGELGVHTWREGAPPNVVQWWELPPDDERDR